jgi:hypothetical protein
MWLHLPSTAPFPAGCCFCFNRGLGQSIQTLFVPPSGGAAVSPKAVTGNRRNPSIWVIMK